MTNTDDFSDLPISSRDVVPLILSGPWTRHGEGSSGDDFDDESQLRAIRGVLVRNRTAEIKLEAEIEKLDALAKATRSERDIEGLHHLLAVSSYQGAAHSMVAASLLAPFIEGVLSRAVRGVERLKGTRTARNRSRIDWRTIRQGIGNFGIKTYMPRDFDQVADALFLYRNKVLHRGLEWPREDRNEFNSRRKNWPSDWFSTVMSNNVPVIFLMAPTLVRRCFVLADQIIGGVITFEEDNRALFSVTLDDVPPGYLQAAEQRRG